MNPVPCQYSGGQGAQSPVHLLPAPVLTWGPRERTFGDERVRRQLCPHVPPFCSWSRLLQLHMNPSWLRKQGADGGSWGLCPLQLLMVMPPAMRPLRPTTIPVATSISSGGARPPGMLGQGRVNMGSWSAPKASGWAEGASADEFS